MPGILHKARQPNWSNEPFTEGAMGEQKTLRLACLGSEVGRDSWH